jgi:hypothetical protein
VKLRYVKFFIDLEVFLKMCWIKKHPPLLFKGRQEGGPWSRVEDLHLIKRDPISLALYIIVKGVF